MRGGRAAGRKQMGGPGIERPASGVGHLSPSRMIWRKQSRTLALAPFYSFTLTLLLSYPFDFWLIFNFLPKLCFFQIYRFRDFVILGIFEKINVVIRIQ